MKSKSIALFLFIIILLKVDTQEIKMANQTLLENIFIEKSNGPISYSVKIVSNPNLPKNLKEKILYEKCIEKTGVLNYMKAQKKNVLLVKPIFISITTKSINFFDSYDKSSLILSIKLQGIERIAQHFLGTMCIDIIYKENSILPKSTTVCAKNKLELNKWIGWILEFKNCGLIITSEGKNKRFEKNPENIVKEDKLKTLKYDNQKKIIQTTTKEIIKKEVVSKKLNTLLKTIRKGKFARRKLRRVMVGKLRNVEHVKEIGLKKEEEIKQMLTQRSVFEREKELNLIKLAHEHKEVKLIQRAKQRLKRIRVYYKIKLRGKH